MELKHFIGDKIKTYRKSLKMTQTELAEKLGTTKQTISRYEKGDRKADQDTLFALVDIFDISIDDFFPPNTGKNSTTTPQSPTDELTARITDKVVQLTTPRKKSVLGFATEQLEAQEKESEKIHTLHTPADSSAIAPQTDVEEKVVSLDDYRKRVTGIVDFAASAGSGVWQEENLGIEVSFYEDDMAEDYDSIGVVVGHSMEPTLKNGDYLFVKVTTDIPNGAISIWQVNGENYVKKFRNNGTPYLQSLNSDYDDIPLTPDDDIRPLAVVVDVYREG